VVVEINPGARLSGFDQLHALPQIKRIARPLRVVSFELVEGFQELWVEERVEFPDDVGFAEAQSGIFS